MSLSIWVGKNRFEIGTASFLKSFFSTIFIKLENDNWGSLFPIIMLEFYNGALSYANTEKAIDELRNIRTRFAALHPDQVVWDFENRQLAPPWGKNISPAITSLSNYYVTSDGKDLIDVLMEAFKKSLKLKKDVILSG